MSQTSLFRLLRGAALAACVAAMAVAASAARAGTLNYRTSWIGNTYGFADHKWVQNNIEAISVGADGEVTTDTPWDEAGGEVAQYRDGKVLGFGEATHGWGNSGGEAVTQNQRYIFTAQAIGNEGGHLVGAYPPKGQTWYGVMRRVRGAVGSGAPFKGGVGNIGGKTANSFLVVNAVADNHDAAIRGLAASQSRLYVSNFDQNRIEVYDADSMQQVGRWPVREPGRIAVEPGRGTAADSLWVIVGAGAKDRRVMHYSADGKALAPALALPSGTVPADLAWDPAGRLLVADAGPSEQVLIFQARGQSMQLSATLGEKGGIFSGRAGTPGPLRFNGLTAVGVDQAGNIYVAMNGIGPPGVAGADSGPPGGAVLESYAPDGKRLWSVAGLLFVDGAQVDPGDPDSVYTGSKRFKLDLSQPAGHDWTYAGYTADPFLYPYDPLFHGDDHGRGLPLVRRIDGKLFVYYTDMYSNALKIYRFEPARSEIAIPSGYFSLRHLAGAWPPNQPAKGAWIWRDTAGRGRFEPSDFDTDPGNADSAPTAWWVDTRGDVWQGTWNQGIRRFPMQGLDHTGNPIYRFSQVKTYPMPAPFNRLTRIEYFDQDDSMFLCGGSPEHPFDQLLWNSAGPLLARYDHWSSGKPVLRYVINLPWKSGSEPAEIGSIAVAGDYLFAVQAVSATVYVYDRATGHEIGTLKPGPEVGNASGWIDVPLGMTAYRRSTGEYLIFVEDDLHGKVLMYRWTPGAPGNS